jgi:hypothetical protein
MDVVGLFDAVEHQGLSALLDVTECGKFHGEHYPTVSTPNVGRIGNLTYVFVAVSFKP